MLTEADLRELGLRMGDRKLMWKWICERNVDQQMTNASTSSLVASSVPAVASPPVVAVSQAGTVSQAHVISSSAATPEILQVSSYLNRN
jgi:hypothetical protein